MAEIRIARCICFLTASLSIDSTLAVDVPTAGSQLQTVRPTQAQPLAAPDLRIEKNDATAESNDQSKIVVNRLHIRNATKFSEAELIAASGFTPGSELTLTALRTLAARIADHYRRHGYFLAQATLPPQDVVNGSVTIAVSEGRYGEVVVRNQSRLADGIANDLIDGIETGDAVDIETLETRLLLLSDLPGVNVKSTLTPGASVGASDLIIEITADRSLSGNIEADNFGSRYTGRSRFGGLLNLNNPLGRGDVASLRALTSADGFAYGRGAYQAQLSRTTLGVAYTALDYELGEEFKSLEAHGTAQIASVYARYPLLRLRRSNLSLLGNIDRKNFRDSLDVTSPATITKKQADVAMVSLLGDRRDGFGGGGINHYSATWTLGSIDLKDRRAASAVSSTAQAAGDFNKVGLSFQRLQSIVAPFSLFAAIQAQWTSDNLDVSERMALGGATSVRAYPEGEAYVDKGYMATIEGRLLVPGWKTAIPSQLQVIAFADTASGESIDATAANRRTLSGVGLGLNWFAERSFTARVTYAHKVGSSRATSVPDSPHRFWFTAVKYF